LAAITADLFEAFDTTLDGITAVTDADVTTGKGSNATLLPLAIVCLLFICLTLNEPLLRGAVMADGRIGII
jgi:hypothetical protein